MTADGTVWAGPRTTTGYAPRPGHVSGLGSGLGTVAESSGGSSNLGDILERVLDKGLVIAGDIRVNLMDIELLTIKLRLVVVSVDTARQMGMDWWTRDPWLVSGATAPAREDPEGEAT